MPAKKFGSQIDLQKIPVVGLVPESAVTASAPASPVNGQLWYDSQVGRLYVREAGAWVLVSDTGVELTANKGATNGYAALVAGTVPIAQIPTGTTASTVVIGNDGRLTGAQQTTGKDQANGYAGLDATTRIVSAELPLALPAAGLTGATAASRYVGATASGAPASGTFVVGDFVVDQTGNVWVCTVSGTPGTWISVFRLGTTATTAAAGNDTRLSDQRVPTDNSVTGGTAGAGVKIQTGTITDVNVNAANKDGIPGLASMRTLGTGSQQAAAGNDARLSDARTPTGAIASGSLAGSSYPNPVIANLAIVDGQVAAANKDGLTTVPSLRTLGTGAQQALAGNTRLDQITAPTADVSLNNRKITTLADPVNPQDAATKAYVDATSVGLDVKQSVRVATTGPIAGATYTATAGASARGQLTTMPTAIDGITLVAGNRVLVKDQAAGAQNGLYVVTTLGTGANGVWDRATDFDADVEVTSGAFTFVEDGATNDNAGFVLATPNPIVIGGASGTALSFTQFSGAGSITASNGITKTGNNLTAVGTANRISTSGAGIDIDAAYVGQTSITTLGTVATGTWNATTIAVAKGGTGAVDAPTARTNLGATGKDAQTLGALSAGVELVITHALGTTDVVAAFKTVADGQDVLMSWRTISTTSIGVTADVAYAANAIRSVIVG